MSERARIVCWWGYVVLVIAIFEIAFQRLGFAPAVGVTLLSIVVLGSALKTLVGWLARRPLPADVERREHRAG